MDSVKVRIQGTGPTRTICVRGNTNGSKQGQVLVTVKVYSGFNPVISYTPEGKSFLHNGGNWCLTDVPVPNSSSTAPGSELTVVVWATIGSSILSREEQQFYGLEGGGTDCCAGSGNIVPEVLASARTVPLSLAPVFWSVLASGFGAGATFFNGTWLLTLGKITGGVCTWANEGDGITTPHVELSCESPLAETWKLYLRNSVTEVTYTLPAGEWNALKTNRLSLSSRNGFPAGVIPETITVQPG